MTKQSREKVVPLNHPRGNQYIKKTPKSTTGTKNTCKNKATTKSRKSKEAAR